MIGADGRSTRVVDLQHDRIARRHFPLLDGHLVAKNAAARESLHVSYVCQIRGVTRASQGSGVTDLPAGLAVEGCLVRNDPPGFAFTERVGGDTVAHDRNDLAFGDLGFITKKLRGFGISSNVETNCRVS